MAGQRCAFVLLSFVVFVGGLSWDYLRCGARRVRCSSGKCILRSELCDGKRDCPSGDDEEADGCRARVCRAGEFKCASSGRCVSGKALCNGVPDCGEEAEDEKGCPLPNPTALLRATLRIATDKKTTSTQHRRQPTTMIWKRSDTSTSTAKASSPVKVSTTTQKSPPTMKATTATVPRTPTEPPARQSTGSATFGRTSSRPVTGPGSTLSTPAHPGGSSEEGVPYEEYSSYSEEESSEATTSGAPGLSAAVLLTAAASAVEPLSSMASSTAFSTKEDSVVEGSTESPEVTQSEEFDSEMIIMPLRLKLL